MGLVAFLAALVASLAWRDGPASAQTSPAAAGTIIVVNTASDESNSDGDCSLREATRAANSNAAVDGCAAGKARARDAINFSLGRGATITLKRTLPTIKDTAGLTIFGGETAKIVVSGDNKVRVLVVKKDARLTLRSITIANGSAPDDSSDTAGSGAGVANRGGTLRVARSTFSGNEAILRGGAISNIRGAGVVRVINSTFSGNGADTGGGIANAGGTLNVAYSTFSGNNADEVGAGIVNANVRNSTMRLASSIFANSDNKGNVANICFSHPCNAKLIDGGYNISDDKTSQLPAPTSRNNTDPRLDPDGLQNNGGPTQTIALRKVSPAIDFIPKGTNGCGVSVKIDQRGVERPQGMRCDAGAFERRR
jgi:CSLREA domain-containing protein